MSDTATLLLVIVAAVAVSTVAAVIIVRRSQARADAALAEVGAPDRRIAATALGMSGDDGAALRGTGTLVLTSAEVAFAQWRPQRLVRIPRAAIVDVDATREHLGKTMRTDVLRITWRAPGSGGGDERVVAFFLRDLDPWLRDLRA